jgi:hypothetical protein
MKAGSQAGLCSATKKNESRDHVDDHLTFVDSVWRSRCKEGLSSQSIPYLSSLSILSLL